MQFHGTRRARALSFLVFLLLLGALWRAGSLYVQSARRQIGPELIARLQQKLGRELRVDALDVDRPGVLSARGVHVARDTSFRNGEALVIQRLELRYNPALLTWGSLLTRGLGQDTRAHLEAHGIVARQPLPFPAEELASADAVSLDFDLQPVLQGGGDVAGTIRQVDVSRPRARLERDRNGHWSFERLFPRRKTPPTSRFRGRIVATNAEVGLRDWKVAALPAPQQNVARGNVIVDFAAYPVVRFQARGSLPGVRGGMVAAQGHRDARAERTFITLSASSGDAAYWYRYFVAPNTALSLGAGSGVAAVTLWNEPHAPLAYRLDLSLRNASGQVYGIADPVQGFNGQVQVDPSRVAFRGSGVTSGAPLQADGEVALGAALGTRFHLASDRLTLAALQRAFPRLKLPATVSTPGPIHATVDVARGREGWMLTGVAGAPNLQYRNASARNVSTRFQARFGAGAPPDVSGSVAGAALTYNKLDAQNVRGSFRWRGDVVQVDAQLAAWGGTATGRGWLDLRGEEPQVYVAGSAQDLDVSRLEHGQKDLKLAGKASAEFVVTGREAAPHVSAFVRAAPLLLNEEQVDALEARVRYVDGEIDIPYATIRDHRLQATLSGAMAKDGALRFHAAAAGLDLRRLLTGRLAEPVAGSAYVSGEIRGTWKEPRVTGKLQVYDPRFREYAADYFGATVQAQSFNDVQLSDVKLIRGLATAASPAVRLTHSAEPKAPWLVDGELNVDGLDLASALRLAGMASADLRKQPLAADVKSLRIALSGPLTAPRLQFETRLENVAAQQTDLGSIRAAGAFDLGARVVTLTSAAMDAPNLRASASGAIRFDPQATAANFRDRTTVDLALHVEPIRLTPWLTRFVPGLARYARVEASLASADAHISGTLSAPNATADARFTAVTLNGRAVELDPVHLEGSRDVVVARGVRVHLGSGLVEAPALALLLQDDDPARRTLDRVAGAVTVSNVPVSVLRQLLEDSPYYATDAAKSLREALAEWRGPMGGVVTAGVTVPLGPERALTGSAAEITRALRARTGPVAAVGNLDVTGLASPPVADRPGTRLAGGFSYSARRLELRQVRLEQPGGAQLSLDGYVDGPLTRNRMMRVVVAASEVKLPSLLRLPVARLREALTPVEPLDGVATLRGEVTGDPEKPHARFSLALQRPSVAGFTFDSFKLENAEYTGEAGDKARLSFASATLVKHLPDKPDATATASGFLPLAWPGLSIPRNAARSLHVEAPRQSITLFTTLANEAETQAQTQPNLPAARAAALFHALAATEGEVEAQVTLGGTADAPRNSGSIALTGATLRPPGLETEVRNFEARAVLEGNLARLERFHGESSRGGSFAGGGEVVFGRSASGNAAARLDLTLDVDSFKFSERRLGKVVGESFKGTQVQGTLRSVSPGNPSRRVPLTLAGEWPAPTLSGALALNDARMVLAMEGASDAPPRPLPGDVRLNVRLLAGENVWLRNPGAQMRFTGALLAGNTLAQPVITGDLRASRGTMNLPTMRLRGVSGLVRVSYDRRNADLGVPAAPPLYVDLSGSSSIRIQRTPNTEAETYDLTVEIRGSPVGGESTGIRAAGLAGGLAVGTEGGLTVTVRTDPPLPNYQIEALIRQQFGAEGFAGGGSNVVEALKTQIEEAFAVNLASAITSPIEEKLESALGLSIFSIDIGVSQPLRVQIGRRLFGPIFGTVTQEFGPADGTQQRRFEVYYRITPQLRIGYRQEEPIDRQVFFISGGFSF